MSLPPGFRFHPTDDELVNYYLKRKVDGLAIELEVIPAIDLYKSDPWELPEKSFLPKRDMEWFFFCPRDKKYPNGSRTNRATTSGYWKATGKDRKVFCESSIQALRKTLVFYLGRAPGGERTDWVMHEYRLCEDLSQPVPHFLGAFALCRVMKRNEHGLKVGEPQGESKGKRSFFPHISSEFSRRRKCDKEMNSIEECSSGSKLFQINNDTFATSQSGIMGMNMQPFSMAETNESSEIFVSELVHYQPDCRSSAEACQSDSISRVTSYASLTDETNHSAEDFTTQGIFSNTPSSAEVGNLNMYFNEEDLGLQGFEWDMSAAYTNASSLGIEAYNMPWYTSTICRQASDVDELNLWLQDENLTVM